MSADKAIFRSNPGRIAREINAVCGQKGRSDGCNAYENGFLCGTKKAAPRSVPWDGCNITAVPPKLHTAFCRMPLDAPITWGRPGGDYSCFPASAQKRQHTAPPYRVFSSPPALWMAKTTHTLFPCIYKKNIAFFVRFVNLFLSGTKFSQLPFSVRAAFSAPHGKARATGGKASPLPFLSDSPAPGAAGQRPGRPALSPV